MSAAQDLKTTGLIEVLSTYKDICQQIEFYETLLLESELEYKRNRKTLIGGPLVKPSHLSIDRQLTETVNPIFKYSEIEEKLKWKRNLKKKAEEALRKFEGIEYQVAYKRFVEGKTLKETAEDLNYAYGYIRRISMQIDGILKK